MNPDEQKPTEYTETPEAPQAQTSPWQSSQGQPVVHTVETPQPTLTQPPKPKRSFGQKVKAMLRSWKFWLAVVALLLAAVIAAWFIQPSRWWLVNTFGGRNTLTITTIAPGEGKAKVSELRNVAVVVNGVTYHTDSKGQLKVPHMPYGNATITATKNGFQNVSYGVVLDFDPFLYKFGGKATDDAARNITLSLKSTGIPVAFKVVDWLSGNPVTTGEFAIGDVVAKPDDQGLVSLKVPGTDAQSVTVNATFGGVYVDKKFDVALTSSTPTIQMIPGGRDYFLSKKSGVWTVYGANLDGSDTQPIVTGTGQETDATSFAVSPDGKYGVLSSSRDGARNAHHDLLQRIYIVNLTTKQITRVDEGVNVTFADWSGNELLYTTTGYDQNNNDFPVTLRGVDVASQRVYNFETADDVSVATVGAGRVVYMRTSNSGPDKESSPVLREAPVNATTSQTLGDQVSYDSYIQQDESRINFKTAQDQSWHEYNLSSDQLKTIEQPSTGSNTVQYLSTTSSDGNTHLMIDRVDGRYTLFAKDNSGKQTVLYGEVGLSAPIRWLSDHVVLFRVNSSTGVADYVVSLETGKHQKVTDVTDFSTGTDQNQRFSFY